MNWRFLRHTITKNSYLVISTSLTSNFLNILINQMIILDLIINIITWMTCCKSAKARLKTYFEGIEEIQILYDLFISYSHTKFNRIFKYRAIETLFEVFMAEHREQFLSSFTGEQRARYEEELTNIAVNFNKQQWKPSNTYERF